MREPKAWHDALRETGADLLLTNCATACAVNSPLYLCVFVPFLQIKRILETTRSQMPCSNLREPQQSWVAVYLVLT